MKAQQLFTLVLLSLLMLSSCSGNLRVEKRHYRSGWYVSSVQKQNETKTFKEKVVSAEPLESIPVKKVFTLIESDSMQRLTVPSVSLKEEKQMFVEKIASETSVKPNTVGNVHHEKNLRPDDDEKAARNKMALVSVLASLSAVCILLGLILLSTGMLPLFMIFAVLLAITALGIYSEKKHPERHHQHEPSSQDPSGIDKGERTFFLLLAGFFALVIIGLGALLLLFLDLLGAL